MIKRFIEIKIETDAFEGFHITIENFSSFYLEDLYQVNDFFNQILNRDEGHCLIGQRMYKELKEGKQITQGRFSQ